MKLIDHLIGLAVCTTLLNPAGSEAPRHPQPEKSQLTMSEAAQEIARIRYSLRNGACTACKQGKDTIFLCNGTNYILQNGSGGERLVADFERDPRRLYPGDKVSAATRRALNSLKLWPVDRRCIMPIRKIPGIQS